MKIKKYLQNCFLLIIPILLWNITLNKYLPKAYREDVLWNKIPEIIGFSENVLRIIVFALSAIMILSIKTKLQKTGLGIYLTGLVIYCLSWLMVIFYPESYWSISMAGFMAPAFTPLIWFTGIGLVGNRGFIRIPHITVLYIALSLLFVVFHTIHAFLVYQQI